jgi:hypothetical protein
MQPAPDLLQLEAIAVANLRFYLVGLLEVVAAVTWLCQGHVLTQLEENTRQG